MCPVLFWCFVIKNWLLKCYTCSHIDLLVCDYLNAKLQARETVGWGLGDWLGGWKCWKGDWVSSKQQRASGKRQAVLRTGCWNVPQTVTNGKSKLLADYIFYYSWVLLSFFILVTMDWRPRFSKYWLMYSKSISVFLGFFLSRPLKGLERAL